MNEVILGSMTMQGRLSPYFVEITRDACLKSFWRKKSLRSFLSQNRISNNALAHLSGMRKREFLEWLFEQLLAKKDNSGHQIILQIGRNLAAQSSFPDLLNWEDADIKVRDAVAAVNQLKEEVAKLDRQISNRKQKEQIRREAEKRRETNIFSQQALEQLKSKLDKLATKVGTQQAGYDFQDWFYKLVDYFEIACKRPYVSGGRQVDGSVTLDGTTFLIELKFTEGPAGAPDIDVFKSKVMSKADNTMGIMVSMSGFTSVAVQEASGMRTPLILMDFNHLYYVLGRAMTLPEVINRLKRHAAHTAEAYLSVTNFGK